MIKVRPMAMPAGQDDFEAKHDADTLMRAEEIRGDKGRHEKAQKHVRKRFHSAARAMTSGRPKGAKRERNKFTANAKLAPMAENMK